MMWKVVWVVFAYIRTLDSDVVFGNLGWLLWPRD